MKSDDLLEKYCKYCEKASVLSDPDQMLCRYRGVVSASHVCRRFRYDPLKRQPKRLSSPLGLTDWEPAFPDAESDDGPVSEEKPETEPADSAQDEAEPAAEPIPEAKDESETQTEPEPAAAEKAGDAPQTEPDHAPGGV